jgi:electron transfer flavoprotein beta subunit
MRELGIIVCAKQIPDPEAPLSDVSVDAERKEVIVDAPMVINPFDENALEAALQLQEGMGGKITVLSLEDYCPEPGQEGLGHGIEKEPGSRC